MNSSDWLNVLNKTAVNIRSEITKASNESLGYRIQERKHALDEAAQRAIEKTLTSLNISCNVVSEEGNFTVGNGGPTLITDPVDGTTNLARGLKPAVCCLSVSTTGMLSGTIVSIISDLYSGETYTSEVGRGSRRDGQLIKVSANNQVKNALLSIDISKTPNFQRIQLLMTTGNYFRMLGSSAFSLCLIASGVLDAHVDVRGTLRATDVAAGLNIIKAAGGVFSINNVVGGDLKLTRQQTLDLIAASTPELLQELLTLTKA